MGGEYDAPTVGRVVDRDEEDLVGLVENVLRSVAVVEIKVQNGYLAGFSPERPVQTEIVNPIRRNKDEKLQSLLAVRFGSRLFLSYRVLLGGRGDVGQQWPRC